jgi:hypothetical protein
MTGSQEANVPLRRNCNFVSASNSIMLRNGNLYFAAEFIFPQYGLCGCWRYGHETENDMVITCCLDGSREIQGFRSMKGAEGEQGS